MWLIAEGVVILSGLAYNGRDADGNIFWNGGANVKLRVYENSTRFQHVRIRIPKAYEIPVGRIWAILVALISVPCANFPPRMSDVTVFGGFLKLIQ